MLLFIHALYYQHFDGLFIQDDLIIEHSLLASSLKCAKELQTVLK